MRPPVVIAGASGYIGSHLALHLAEAGYHILAVCRGGQAFTHNNITWVAADLLDKAQLSALPVLPGSVFINAAGYPSPDFCEQFPEESHAQNVTATSHLIDWAQQNGAAQLIHLSTDLVFGEDGPHRETDSMKPILQYGRDKRLAEQLFAGISVPYTILRPVMLYGPVSPGGRSGFVQMVVRRLQAGETLRMAGDQVRNPTFITDLCRFTEHCIAQSLTGVFNVGGDAFVNIFEFTTAIAATAGLPAANVTSIDSADLPAGGAPRALRTGVVNALARENGLTLTEMGAALRRSV